MHGGISKSPSSISSSTYAKTCLAAFIIHKTHHTVFTIFHTVYIIMIVTQTYGMRSVVLAEMGDLEH